VAEAVAAVWSGMTLVVSHEYTPLQRLDAPWKFRPVPAAYMRSQRIAD
jgi:hypothetical protein